MGKRNRKTTELIAAVASISTVETNHAAPGSGDEGLDALMSSISGTSTEASPATETIEDEAILESLGDDDSTTDEPTAQPIESSLESAAPVEASPEVIEPADATEPVVVTPVDAEADKAAAKAAKKVAREAAAAVKKAEREAAKLAAEAKPKRVFYGKNNLGRMTALMGLDTLRENVITTLDDAALTGAALTARQDEAISSFKDLSVKVQRRTTYILEFAHKGVADASKLNEVIRRAFEVLNRDGKIVSGEKGNYATLLLAKPYDLGTVRTAGMNSLNAMKHLQVVIPHESEKQTYVLNPASLVAAKVNGLLGYAAK